MCDSTLVREINAWALGSGEFTARMYAPLKYKSITIFLTDTNNAKRLRVSDADNGWFEGRANIYAKEKWAPPLKCYAEYEKTLTLMRDFNDFLNIIRGVLGYGPVETEYGIMAKQYQSMANPFAHMPKKAVSISPNYI